MLKNNKIAFNLLWQLHQAESLTKMNFNDVFDYTKFTDEWKKQQKSQIGQKSFDKEYPFGKEKIEVTMVSDTMAIIHFKNIPRQSGKSTLCTKFCKGFKNSIYLHPQSMVARHKQTSNNIKTGRCSRPRDLDNGAFRGAKYEAFCLDDFQYAEDSNISHYIEKFKNLSNGRCIVLVVD